MGSNYVKFWHTGEKLSPESTQKIKAIQKSMNILDDGFLGEHTLDRIYREYAKPQECYDDVFYNAYVITGHPNNLVCGYLGGKMLPPNSISGVFHNPATKKVSAGLGMKNNVIFNGSSHCWADKPDMFIYIKDGVAKVKRAVWFGEDCDFFISGLGLHNWNPELEGYCKFVHAGKTYNHSDVHRKTWHNGFGVYPDGYIVLVYMYGTSAQLKDLMINKMKCKFAVMGDGGDTYGGINGVRYKKWPQNRQNNFIGFKW